MSVAINGTGSITGIDQGFNITSGSVGIGTDNPTAPLQINHASPKIILRDNDNDADISVASIGGAAVYSAASDIIFQTSNSSEKLRITSGGKVGIRTDNPKQIFSVVGRANFDLQGDYYGSWINGDSQGSSSFNVGAWHNAGGRMRNEGSHLVLETMNTSHWIQLQPSGGNVSVGSNNANGLLALTAASGRLLTLRNSTTGSGSGDGSYLALNGSDLQIANAESANVILYTADTERLRITSAGKLTVTPEDTTSSYATTDGGIDIAQTINSTGTSSSQSIGIQFSLNKSGQTGAIAEIGAIREGSGLSGLVFRTRDNSTGRNERLRITSDGKLCVNTTLSNYGVVQIRDASGDSTTSAIQVENASSGNSTTNVILRSVSLNSGAWANAEYRAKSHVFSYHTTPVLSVLANYGPWAEGNKGTTRGTLHLRPGTTDHMGGAITFGASDSGSGETAMAGIYTRSDGTYGTKMYFATTNSYATGPKNAMYIDHYGYVHDSNRPFIYGTPTNTNGSGVANSMSVLSSRNLTFSNSRITVPVSGVYHICFNTICDNSSSRVDAHIYVNGSVRVNSLSEDTTAGYHYRGMSISLMLSANDYIQFNNNDWYSSGTTSAEYWRTASVVFLG